MAYPPPIPQPRKGLSHKMIGAIVGGVALVCCVGPLALVVGTGVLGNLMTEDLTAQVVSCEVEGRSVDVQWEATNPNSSKQLARIQIVVEDADGRQVAETTRSKWVDADTTLTDSTWLIADVEGGESCEVSVE